MAAVWGIVQQLPSMFCAISGNTPRTPVVSPKSGNIFELELITQYIEEHGKDPITNDPLSIDELIEIKQIQTITPPKQLNSIPQLLSALQNEYDSMALEMFSLRKTLEETRKELSTALYHHDAATRVASRLLKERDEARKALEKLTVSLGGDGHEVVTQSTQSVQMDHTLPQDIATAIIDASQELFKIHSAEKRKINIDKEYVFKDITKVNNVKPYKAILSCTSNNENAIVTGKTGKSSIFNVASNELVNIDSIGVSKDITKILPLGNNHYIVGFKTGEVHYNQQPLNTNHQTSIVSILQHPLLINIIFTVDETGLLSIINLDQGAVVFNKQASPSATVADIHMDGALLAIGDKEGDITLLDLKSGEVPYTLKSTGELIVDLKFGKNGYWLFASYGTTGIEIWDLRHNTSFKVPTERVIQKIAFEKSSQLVLGLDEVGIEFIRYFKAGKSWAVQNTIPLAGAVDLAVVDDTEKNKVDIIVVHSSSEIARYSL